MWSTDAGWDMGASERCWCGKVAGDSYNWRGKKLITMFECVKLPWRSTREMTGAPVTVWQSTPETRCTSWFGHTMNSIKMTNLGVRPSEAISDPSCTLCEDESSDQAVLVLLFLIIQIKRPGERNNADGDYWEGLDRYLLLLKQIIYCSEFQTPLGSPCEVSVSLCLPFTIRQVFFIFLFVLHKLNKCVFIPM